MIPQSTIYSIDPDTAQVGNAGALNGPRSEAAAVTIGDTIYLAGGWSGSAPLAFVGTLTPASSTTAAG
jgi:hypothetical protein